MNFGQNHGREAFGVGSQPKRSRKNNLKNYIVFNKSRKPRLDLGTMHRAGWSKAELMFKNLR